MSARQQMREEADLIVDYGTVDGSTQTARFKNVLADVNGIGDGVERAEEMDMFGNAAVMLRPVAPSNGSSFEVIFFRQGEQLLPIASREPRWQIDLEEGEVVLRSLTETPARIYLKPDGSCVIEATSIIMQSDDVQAGGNSTLAHADNLDAHLSQIAKSLDELRTTLSGSVDPNYGAAAKIALDAASPIPTTKTKGA